MTPAAGVDVRDPREAGLLGEVVQDTSAGRGSHAEGESLDRFLVLGDLLPEEEGRADARRAQEDGRQEAGVLTREGERASDGAAGLRVQDREGQGADGGQNELGHRARVPAEPATTTPATGLAALAATTRPPATSLAATAARGAAGLAAATLARRPAGLPRRRATGLPARGAAGLAAATLARLPAAGLAGLRQVPQSHSLLLRAHAPLAPAPARRSTLVRGHRVTHTAFLAFQLPDLGFQLFLLLASHALAESGDALGRTASLGSEVQVRSEHGLVVCGAVRAEDQLVGDLLALLATLDEVGQGAALALALVGTEGGADLALPLHLHDLGLASDRVGDADGDESALAGLLGEGGLGDLLANRLVRLGRELTSEPLLGEAVEDHLTHEALAGGTLGDAERLREQLVELLVPTAAAAALGLALLVRLEVVAVRLVVVAVGLVVVGVGLEVRPVHLELVAAIPAVAPAPARLAVSLATPRRTTSLAAATAGVGAAGVAASRSLAALPRCLALARPSPVALHVFLSVAEKDFRLGVRSERERSLAGVLADPVDHPVHGADRDVRGVSARLRAGGAHVGRLGLGQPLLAQQAHELLAGEAGLVGHLLDVLLEPRLLGELPRLLGGLASPAAQLGPLAGGDPGGPGASGEATSLGSLAARLLGLPARTVRGHRVLVMGSAIAATAVDGRQHLHAVRTHVNTREAAGGLVSSGRGERYSSNGDCGHGGSWRASGSRRAFPRCLRAVTSQPYNDP